MRSWICWRGCGRRGDRPERWSIKVVARVLAITLGLITIVRNSRDVVIRSLCARYAAGRFCPGSRVSSKRCGTERSPPVHKQRIAFTHIEGRRETRRGRRRRNSEWWNLRPRAESVEANRRARQRRGFPFAAAAFAPVVPWPDRDGTGPELLSETTAPKIVGVAALRPGFAPQAIASCGRTMVLLHHFARPNGPGPDRPGSCCTSRRPATHLADRKSTSTRRAALPGPGRRPARPRRRRDPARGTARGSRPERSSESRCRVRSDVAQSQGCRGCQSDLQVPVAAGRRAPQIAVGAAGDDTHSERAAHRRRVEPQEQNAGNKGTQLSCQQPGRAAACTSAA